MIDCKELKRNARATMKEAHPHPALVTLVVLAILLVTQVLSLAVNGELALYRSLMQSAMDGELETVVYALVNGSGSVSVRSGTGLIPWLLTLALDLMTMVISMGYSLYSLRVHRREHPGVGDVFDAFGRFFRVVVLSLLRGLIISTLSGIYVFVAAFVGTFVDMYLATVLCLPALAPMFMASYAYRLADFLVFDHPEYSAVQSLALSRMAMKGRKWELCKLDLSFFGWMLLCVFPPMILWVRPYMTVAAAGFYDRVVPAFWEEVKTRQNMFTPKNNAPGGWSVPGESGDKDDPDDPDDRDWF